MLVATEDNITALCSCNDRKFSLQNELSCERLPWFKWVKARVNSRRTKAKWTHDLPWDEHKVNNPEVIKGTVLSKVGNVVHCKTKTVSEGAVIVRRHSESNNPTRQKAIAEVLNFDRIYFKEPHQVYHKHYVAFQLTGSCNAPGGVCHVLSGMSTTMRLGGFLSPTSVSWQMTIWGEVSRRSTTARMTVMNHLQKQETVERRRIEKYALPRIQTMSLTNLKHIGSA